jgi:hypothetical protein
MARWVVVPVLVAATVGAYAGATGGSHTTVTIWAAAPPVVTAYGGATYGGYMPPSGAMITEQREVDVEAGGEVRVSGVASTLDAASVQLRDLTDPGTAVREQRFVPGANTPDEILARHIGEAVSIVTTKGEVNGTLRAVDAQSLVVEIGAGDQRRLQILQREGYVQDVRLAAGTAQTGDKPSLVWRLAPKKPGRHSIAVTYRAEGMSWTADYLAVLDDAQKTIDFSAWATIKNQSGAAFDNAEVVLVSGGTGAVMPAAASPYAMLPPRPNTPLQRYPVASPVKLGNGDSVQVELFPARVAAKARSVVTFEAMPDPSAGFQAYPATDCNQWNASNAAGARAEVAVELDVPSSGPLPDGRVRMFKRKGDKLEVLSEDQLRSSAGVARIRLAPNADVTGERKALSCAYDDRARTIHEKLEVKVENKGKQAVDVVVREFAWRWPVWRIDPADETVKGARAGAQTQEYRLSLPAGAKKSVTYSVSYSW